MSHVTIAMGLSALVLLFLIAQDLSELRDAHVPSEREILLEEHNRMMDSIRKGF